MSDRIIWYKKKRERETKPYITPKITTFNGQYIKNLFCLKKTTNSSLSASSLYFIVVDRKATRYNITDKQSRPVSKQHACNKWRIFISPRKSLYWHHPRKIWNNVAQNRGKPGIRRKTAWMAWRWMWMALPHSNRQT